MNTLQLLPNGTCFPKESFQYKMQGIFFLKKIKLKIKIKIKIKHVSSPRLFRHESKTSSTNTFICINV